MDYLERAKNWRRVATAEELAGLLTGVKPKRWRDYQYLATPPCHSSQSGQSTAFAFGNAPGGGLVIHCWACHGEAGYLDRLEATLGVALQTRYQNGRLRYAERLSAAARPPPPPGSPGQRRAAGAAPLLGVDAGLYRPADCRFAHLVRRKRPPAGPMAGAGISRLAFGFSPQPRSVGRRG